MKLACDIHLMGGDFASQPLAFAHLLDAAQAQALSLDLDHIEVIPRPFGKRLSQWLTPDIITGLDDLPQATLIAFLPGSGGPLAATDHLTPLGAVPATITRAPILD